MNRCIIWLLTIIFLSGCKFTINIEHLDIKEPLPAKVVGIIKKLDSSSVAGYSVYIANQSAVVDETGEFEIAHLRHGDHLLSITDAYNVFVKDIRITLAEGQVLELEIIVP